MGSIKILVNGRARCRLVSTELVLDLLKDAVLLLGSMGFGYGLATAVFISTSPDAKVISNQLTFWGSSTGIETCFLFKSSDMLSAVVWSGLELCRVV